MNDQPAPFWSLSPGEALERVHASYNGLDDETVTERKKNHYKRPLPPFLSDLLHFLAQFKKPLTLLLLVALFFSAILEEYVNAGIILGILLLSSTLGFVQERNAGKAIEKLRSLIRVKVSVRRNGLECSLPPEDVVEGDIILLNAGDIVPADCLILESEDLYVNEAALTGESFPAEKKPGQVLAGAPLIQRNNTVFSGSNVVSGTATVLAMACGAFSELGKLEKELDTTIQETAFERGLRTFGLMLMRAALIMAGIILIINISTGKPALDSLLFALSLSLGLTPEILPAIVAITLASGAKRLAAKKVIVKKLSAIQNFGAIDILCSDKTGTLTEGEVQVFACLRADGTESTLVKQYAYLNACYESGYSNPIDEAIRANAVSDISGFSKFDEVPYDFIRKRLSVVVEKTGQQLMITKGAVKNILQVCTCIHTAQDTVEPIQDHYDSIASQFDSYCSRGFRTLGIAYKDVSGDPVINKDDESEMIFLGFILLFDPPRKEIASLVDALKKQKVSLKIITGDNVLIARTTAAQIGIASDKIISGAELHVLSDEALARKAQIMDIFAEIEPSQKERIVRALQKKGHVVGYLGDGINDASALKAADVGISVHNAVDVAKESADLILLEKGLDVILEGIAEGRKTYLNTLKYIFITISANFGNMFSMAGASIFLPFMPLLPAQILLTNFVTDLPALAIASDNVDREMLRKPRRWDNKLIRNFMLLFGLESSLFDFITFGALLFFFKAGPESFRTGWFIETVITEVAILLVIRTRRTFFKSNLSALLMGISAFVVVGVIILPYLPFARAIGFTPLPIKVVAAMIAIALVYALVGEISKKWLFRKMRY
ncbi:MAG: magnesium-translocating P-type ATPase [Saprospiraceae bacterium]